MSSPDNPLRFAFAALLACCAALSQAEEIRIGGTGSALGVMRLQAEAFHATGTKTRASVLEPLGSSGGVKALRAGVIEVAVLSRPPTEEERRGLAFSEYATSPLVFAAWPAAKLEAVSSAELVELYSGRRARWPDGTTVRLVLRPAADIDTAIVAGISAELRDALAAALRRPGMIVADNDVDAVNFLERTEGAFGVTVLALVLAEKRRVKILRLDGVAPSVRSLADGRYPLRKSFWLATASNPGAAAREFVAFVRSPAGRAILERTGHVASGTERQAR